MSRFRPFLVLGTRPEAIKMAPVVAACRARSEQIEPIVCFTGQHDEMLRQVTDYFGIHADFDFKVMSPGQSLAQLTARLLVALDEALDAARPDCVVAQGDTTSVLAASLAAFYRGVPFVHVEAGLRTGTLSAPWPEEFNRRVAGVSSTLHCAPTACTAQNLYREGVPRQHVRVTGNTVIDALLTTIARERTRAGHWESKYAWLARREMILVTFHRRENHGAGLESVCQALARLATSFPENEFVFPVHLNPQVGDVVRQRLTGFDNIHLINPVPYPEFVWLMDRAKLIVSDSGGVQEEAPSLRRPVVALRQATERGEAVDVGAVVCVGCCAERIAATVTRLLTDRHAYAAMQIDHSPFGDGHAAERIVEWMLERLGGCPEASLGLTNIPFSQGSPVAA
jgi:UDP-N-acetylglucosamine 2-epimerase (non-hydrolysing)